MAEYVYGVIERDAPAPDRAGVGGAPLRTLRGRSAAALVSQVPEDNSVELGRDEMLTHGQVLGEALQNGPVLPMRLGIVMENETAVRDRLLDPHDEELAEQLARFRGKFEASVRVVYDEDALLREVVSADPAVARLRTSLEGRSPDATYYERIQLGQLVAEGAERIRAADAENLLSALRQVSLDVNVSPPGHERVALNAAFLLDEKQSREFDEVLEAIAEGQSGRLRFRYTGPLPPHSFVQLAGAA